MWKWLKKRFSEASTYAGLAVSTIGLGQVFKINEAPQIAEAIAGAGEQLLSGNTVGGLIALGLGVAAAFVKEKE